MRLFWSVCVLLVSVLMALPGTVAAQAQPAVTVEPASGPHGTSFQPRITGLPPGTGVVMVMRFPTGREERGPSLAAAPASGEWRPAAWQSAPPEPVGQYTLLIKTSVDGPVLASGSFTVVGTDQAGTPGGQLAAPAGQPDQLPRNGELPTIANPFLVMGFGVLLIGFGLFIGRVVPPRLRR